MYEELKLVPNESTITSLPTSSSSSSTELSSNRDRIKDVSHNSIFNCLFMITESNVLIIYDCNTNRCLRIVNWQQQQQRQDNNHQSSLNFFRLFNIQEKCLSISDRTVCMRMPYEGAYMLDSVFQTVSDSDETKVALELNAYNTEVLINALKSIDTELVNGLEDFVHKLDEQYSQIRSNKVLLNQWQTVRVYETYSTLMNMLMQSLEELKRIDPQSLGIPILSGLIDRLFRLNSANLDSLPSLLASFDKRLMCSEANRRATFHDWPHMEYKWVVPDTLAQAGFFHQSATPGDDRTTCFVCSLCLVTWEPTDQPWSEHERHSPICHFVRGEVTENVPLSLTTATQAAHQVFKTENISCTSEISSDRYFAVSDSEGHIVVYDTKDLLKEMMHVQLINETEASKQSKLKINSLCFYYRNHKHVLYGSFTIDDEVFIFSFNIFDIYRSYQSRPAKKTEKQRKSSSTKISKSSSTSKSVIPAPPIAEQQSSTIMEKAPEITKQSSEECAKNDETPSETQKSELTDATDASTDKKAETPAPPPPVKKQESTENASPAPQQILKELQQQFESFDTYKKNFLFSPFNPNNASLFANVAAKMANSTTSTTNAPSTIPFDIFSFMTDGDLNQSPFGALPPPPPPPPPATSTTTQPMHLQRQLPIVQRKALSNYLIVKFEICSNQESTSKSKSKYKKCIKIQSVHAKVITGTPQDDSPATFLTQKAYEFTEKCLSFRLACIDFSSELHNNFSVKLINLYDKSLLALVNFDLPDKQSKSYKLFQIKHEENAAGSKHATAEPANESQVVPVLAATSSSRLNLVEIALDGMNYEAMHIVTMMAISVTTYEEDNDVRLLAMLDENGAICIVDPFKNAKIHEFSSPTDSDDKFVSMGFCYGIDKICAVTQSGRVMMISTRVSPIVTPSIIDEYLLKQQKASSTEPSDTTKLLVDLPMRSENVNLLHSLIQYDSAKTNFSAKFPSCWSLIPPEQQHQQRKHPQHIHAEAQNHTKTWRYVHNNSLSKNVAQELNVEIYLNKPIQIGCIQIRLKFSKELTAPFELRLYKQPTQTESSSTDADVESKINFNLSKESNYEMLFGPIDVRDYLELNATKTFIITICTNNLLETRSNLYFLNLKPTNTESSSESLLQKVMITIRKYKKAGVPNERLERSMMLKKVDFFKRLFSFMEETSEFEQLKVLDILSWILCNNISQSEIKEDLIDAIGENIERFLITCYVNGKRSLSHKATLFLTFVLSPQIDTEKRIGHLLLDKLLMHLSHLSHFDSSASMYWYFTLFHQVMLQDPQRSYEKCMQMLIKLSKGHEYNPFYALLKMKFNFTGLPFESELFDADQYFKFDLSFQKFSQQQQQQQQQQQGQAPISGSQFTITQQNINNSTGVFAPYPFNFGNIIDSAISNQFGTSTLNINNQQASSNFLYNNLAGGSRNGTDLSGKEFYNLLPQIIGLLEVLPLNFKCISSSQGTTIEKTDSKQDLMLYMMPNCNNYFNTSDTKSSKKASEPQNFLPQFIVTDFMKQKKEIVDMLNKSEPIKSSLDIEQPTTPKNTPFPGETPPNEPQTTATNTNTTGTNIDTSIFNSIFSLQSLQLLVIDRMEPVSRHSVVLDFGFPVALTDIMIPVCSELASISIDMWTHKEQKDSKRLCVSTEISENPILLNDLQPPAVCRYIKLILVANSNNVVKAKIPIGFFFGYPHIFHSETQDENVALLNKQCASLSPNASKLNYINVTRHLSYLEKLYEDSQCHYALAIGKLKKLLNEIKYPNDNIGHLKVMQMSTGATTDSPDACNRIKEVYNECLDYQFQLNLNKQMIKRLQTSLGLSAPKIQLHDLYKHDCNSDEYIEKLVSSMAADKLRVSNSLLVKTLLCLSYHMSSSENELKLDDGSDWCLNKSRMSYEHACELFRNLCVNSNMEREASWLLLRTSYNEEWWGEFIAHCLKSYFLSHVKEIMPLSRIFITLNEICLKSLNGCQASNLFKALFELTAKLLAPFEDDSSMGASVEVTALEWILLFLSRLLSVIDKSRTENAFNNRWEFLENIYTNYKLNGNNNAASKMLAVRNKGRIKKKLFHSSKYFTWNKLKEQRKNFDKYKKNSSGWSKGDNESVKRLLVKQRIALPREHSLRVAKLLIKLLMHANSYCSSDLFVMTCRILSSLCCNTLPSISLTEIIDKQMLTSLILQCVSAEFNHGSVSWGSPWSHHALLSFLTDVIENERMVPSADTTEEPEEKPTDKPSNDLSKNFTHLANLFSEMSDAKASKNPNTLIDATNNLIKSIMDSADGDEGKQKSYKAIASALHSSQKMPPLHFNFNLNGTKTTHSQYQKQRQPASLSSTLSKISMSYDQRLDTTHLQSLEQYLFTRCCLQADQMSRSLHEPPANSCNTLKSKFEPPVPRDVSINLLRETIDSLFTQLDHLNIENTLSFYLSLSISDSSAYDGQFFDITRDPLITLTESTLNTLITTLTHFPYMSIKLWHLSFRVLTLTLNRHPLPSSINQLPELLKKFLSTNESVVGDECCNAFIDLLKRLYQQISGTKHESPLKRNLFELTKDLIDPKGSGGAIATQQGPIDAQTCFIDFLGDDHVLRHFDLDNTDHQSLFTAWYANLASIAHHHIYMYPRMSVKGTTSPRSCFSSVLNSLLGSGTGTNTSAEKCQKANSYFFSNNNHANNANPTHKSALKRASESVLCNRDTLMCLLLKFGINILTRTYKKPTPIAVPPAQHQNQAPPLPKTTQLSKITETPNEMSDSTTFYEDMLMQQLLYDMEDAEPEPEVEPEAETESDLIIDSFALFDQTEGNEMSIEESRYKFEQKKQQQQQTPTEDIELPPKISTEKASSEDAIKEPIIDEKATIKLISSLSDDCLEVFIEALALCQSSALAMVISNTGCPIELTASDIQTPGDGIFVLLKCLCATPKLTQPVYNYLSKLKRLSEPLLWLIGHLFANESALSKFISIDGLSVISRGLQATTRQLLYSGPCVISSIMNHIDIERAHMKLLNSNSGEQDCAEGFTNFAPYGSIVCTSPSANPVDVLVQTAIPHRRMRSAVWSYHFQSDEHKVSLFLTFPYAFLLKEVHIMPHTVSMGNCPAYVSLEVSRDGALMTPVAAPCATIGLTAIKLALNKSELVSAVQINLYRSKDSQMIGLSQIKLLGYPMFENMVSAKPDMMLTPIEDLVSRSNMGWLRLLYLAMSSVSALEKSVCERMSDDTVRLCTHLIASPAMIIYDKIIESILCRIIRHEAVRSVEITRDLLRVERGFDARQLYSMPHGVLMETLVNILYAVNEGDSDDEGKRVQIVLQWLGEVAKSGAGVCPSSMLMHCVACILYNARELPMVSEEFIGQLVRMASECGEYYTKQACDWILCALLHHHPHLIDSITRLIELTKMNLGLIETISFAIQDDRVIEIFIASNFFEKFVQVFTEMLSGDGLVVVEPAFIRLFIALADFERGQQWLGTEIGSTVWKLLLGLLCANRCSYRSHEISLLVTQLVKKMVLCNMRNQSLFALYLTQLIKDLNGVSTISGFLHQLILQVLLEDQTITVNFIKKSELFKSVCNSSLGSLPHPRYGTGSNCRTIELPLSKTCAQLAYLISDSPVSVSAPISVDSKADCCLWDEMFGKVVQHKSADNKGGMKSGGSSRVRLYCSELSVEKYLPVECTLGHVVNAVLNKCKRVMLRDVQVSVALVNGVASDETELREVVQWSETHEHSSELANALHTPLDAFVKCDGLIALAERLPIVTPFIHEPLLNVSEKDRLAANFSGDASAGNGNKTSPDFVDYVIMNESDEAFDDEFYGEMPPSSAQNNQSKLKKITMPPHAFIAFGLFLKIPGYANVMLRNKKQAQCILKLLLGANRNKDEEFGLSLSTMPFTALRELLNDCRLNKSAGERNELCLFVLDNRILTLLLSIFSALSHHAHRQTHPHFSQQLIPDCSSGENSTSAVISAVQNSAGVKDGNGKDVDENGNSGGNVASSSTTGGGSGNSNAKGSNLYWAKGTGFGTGSTIQQWDAERTLMQQKMEEEYVTCIMQILTSYLKCFSDATDDCTDEGDNCNEMPQLVFELFDHSCVMVSLASYFRNDSVLDISRHIPLYRASLELLQALVLNKQLRELVQQCKLVDLLKNMKSIADSYTTRIKHTDEDSGIASLLPLLNDTFALCIDVIKPIEQSNDLENSEKANLTIDKIYCEVMKDLQFDTFAIVSESASGNGSFKMNIPYYYESSLNDMSNLNNANRAKRLAQETVTLSNSLPLSFGSSVFVRCDEERLDVLKVLITGPQDTPYSNGCFEFDVFFPSDYPDSPPLVNLQTTGNQTVRFNPNLYHDGKVCLSILNTWHGRPEERWNAQTSSFLQVLVSIQSLILVSEPYFNEPGYERSRGTPAGTASSLDHDANIRQATVKWAMLEMLKKPPQCFREVVRKHFYLKRKEIRQQCEAWCKELEQYLNDKQIGQSVQKSYVALKRHTAQLYEELDKLEASEAQEAQEADADAKTEDDVEEQQQEQQQQEQQEQQQEETTPKIDDVDGNEETKKSS